jgi:predicted PurR-regulated permease PerM
VLVAISFGLLFGLGLGALGIPFATTLGVIAALLEVIPYLGGAVTVVLAILVALGISVPHAVAVLVLYVILVNVESHILAPLLVGKTVGLPSVIVLAALFIGIETRGIPGVLLAVPVVLVIAAIIDEFWPRPASPAGTGSLRRFEHWLARPFHRRKS